MIASHELSFDSFLPQYPFTPECLKFAEPIPGPTTELFSQKARDILVIILNLYEKERDKTYDTSPVNALPFEAESPLF